MLVSPAGHPSPVAIKIGSGPEDVATADGLLLTLAAVGGFLVPIGFGLIAVGSGFIAAWIFTGAVSIIFALAGFAAREPGSASSLANQQSSASVISCR